MGGGRRGVDACGFAPARFFHPSVNICKKFPDDTKKRFKNVLLTRKALHCISRKDQLAYKHRLPEFDDGTVFHICVNNFQVNKAPVQPFANKVLTAAPAVVPAQESDPSYDAGTSTQDTTNNVGRGASADDIAELR